MKFALGAAAAITGASALIYLLLRPKKRHYDPGKRRSESSSAAQLSKESCKTTSLEDEAGSTKYGDDVNVYRYFNGHVTSGEGGSISTLNEHEANRYADHNGEDFSLDSNIGDICGSRKNPVMKDFSLDGDDDSITKDLELPHDPTEVAESSSLPPCQDERAEVIPVKDAEDDKSGLSTFENDPSQKEIAPEVSESLQSLPCDILVKQDVISSSLADCESTSGLGEIHQGANASEETVSSTLKTEDGENVVSSSDHDHSNEFHEDLCVVEQLVKQEKVPLSSQVSEAVSSSVDVKGIDDAEAVTSSMIVEGSDDPLNSSICDSIEPSESQNQSQAQLRDDHVDILVKNVLDVTSIENDNLKSTLGSEGMATTSVNKEESNLYPGDEECLTNKLEIVETGKQLSSRENLEQECSSIPEGLSEFHSKSGELQELVTMSSDVTNSNLPELEVSDLNGENKLALETSVHSIEETTTTEETVCTSTESQPLKLSESNNSDLLVEDSEDSGERPKHNVESLEERTAENEKDLDAVNGRSLSSISAEECDVKSEHGILECQEDISEIENKHSESKAENLEIGERVGELTEKISKCIDLNVSTETEVVSQEREVKDVGEMDPQSEVTSALDMTQVCTNSSEQSSTMQETSLTSTNECSKSDDVEEKRSYRERVRNPPGHTESSTSTSSAGEKEIEKTSDLDWPQVPGGCEGIDSHHNQNSSHGAAYQTKSQVGVTHQTDDVAPQWRTDNDVEVKISEESKETSKTTDSEGKLSYKERVRNPRGLSNSSTSEGSVEEAVNLESSGIEKGDASLPDSSQDNSKVSSVVQEEPTIAPSKDSSSEPTPVSSPVQELNTENSTKNTAKSLKQDSSPKKSSKPKKEDAPKSYENSRSRSYRERVRNSRGNSTSEVTDNLDVGKANSDNNNIDFKSAEENHVSKVEPETLFNQAVYPASTEESYLFYEFEIPQMLVGRLIGKKGAFVNRIKATTEAAIVVGPHRNRKFKMCSVEGTKQQVEAALSMIRDYFPLDRYPELSLAQVYSSAPSAPPMHGMINNQAMQIELAMGVVVEVRVSAVASGSEIWVQQPLHPSYSALQRLQECMDRNYGDGSTTPQIPGLIPERTVCVAQIDAHWYRCQVLSAVEDAVLVVLLDIGGMLTLPTSALRQIRRDYATLPFQATQCVLHGIQPVSEGGWGDTSTACLEELVSGVILAATVVSYTPDGVPLVNLYRNVQNEYVFINERLVTLGHAQWMAQVPSS